MKLVYFFKRVTEEKTDSIQDDELFILEKLFKGGRKDDKNKGLE